MAGGGINRERWGGAELGVSDAREHETPGGRSTGALRRSTKGNQAEARGDRGNDQGPPVGCGRDAGASSRVGTAGPRGGKKVRRGPTWAFIEDLVAAGHSKPYWRGAGTGRGRVLVRPTRRVQRDPTGRQFSRGDHGRPGRQEGCGGADVGADRRPRGGSPGRPYTCHPLYARGRGGVRRTEARMAWVVPVERSCE